MRLFLWYMFNRSNLQCIKKDHKFFVTPPTNRWSLFPHILNLGWLGNFFTPTECGTAASICASVRSSYKVSQMKEHMDREAQLTASTSPQTCAWGHSGQPSWCIHQKAVSTLVGPNTTSRRTIQGSLVQYTHPQNHTQVNGCFLKSQSFGVILLRSNK